MTLLTSFIIVPRVEIELVVPEDVYLPLGVDKTPPSPVLPEGITTGSMGNSNLKAGAPAVAKGTTGSPIVEMGAALFGNANPLKSKGSLEPVKTEVTKLNKIEPVVTLEIIR